MTTTAQVARPAEAPNAAEAGRYDAFISYSRHDSAFAVDVLVAELRAAGKEVWLDLDISGGAQWLERVDLGIEACKALIFVVTPNSVASEACRGELDGAVSLHKLIIPVIHEDVPADAMPEALADAEWVFLRDGDDRAAGMQKLVAALEADLEWRDQHTRLAGRAREWLDSGRNNSYLLRGADLRAAEVWLADHEGHKEAPTREQVEYITRSRQAAGRRLHTLIGALTTGLAIAIGLAIIALIQRSDAVQQSHVAQSRLLASEAGDSTDLQLASLMALEAHKLSPTLDARSAILRVADTHQVGAPMLTGTSGVSQVVLSPNGKTIAAATYDGTIQLWDLATRRRLLPDLVGHTERVQGIAFSPDGKQLASASFDKTIRFWDVRSHRPIGPPINVGNKPVETVAFTPDGSLLASGGDDMTTRLWDVSTHQQVGPPLRGPTSSGSGAVSDFVSSVAFSPDRRFLASARIDGVIELWDMTTGKLNALLGGEGAGAQTIAFSPDGKQLAAGFFDFTIGVWDVASAHPVARLRGHTNFVYGVAFSPHGDMLASASYDGSVRVWSMRTHQEIGSPFTASSGTQTSVVFTPGGDQVISSGDDGAVRVWTIASPRLLATLHGHSDVVNAVTFSLDGRTLASAGSDARILLWDVAKRTRIGTDLKLPVAGVTSLALSPDGRTLAAALTTKSNGARIEFFDVGDRGQDLGGVVVAANSSTPVYGQTAIAYSPDGKLLAFENAAFGVGLIRLSDHRLLTRSQQMPGTLTLAFSPDGTQLAAGGPEGRDSITLYSVAQQQPIGTLGPLGFPVHAVAWSPDGKTLASGAGDNVIRLWDPRTRRQISLPLTGHAGEINGLAFGPDSRTLASASNDGTIRLWDVQSRRELGAPLTGHAGAVQAIAFNRDGSTLASGGEDQTVRVWTTAPVGTYIRQLCSYIDLKHAPQLWRSAALKIPYQKPC